MGLSRWLEQGEQWLKKRFNVTGQKLTLYKLGCSVALYVVMLCLFAATVCFVLHAWNVYPELLEARQRTYSNALEVWKHTCDEGRNRVAMSNPFSNCKEARLKSMPSPRLLAIEDLLLHLLSDLTLATWLLPHPQSASGYVLLRSLDVILGYIPIMILFLTAVALFYFYTLKNGPVAYYKQHSRHLTYARQAEQYPSVVYPQDRIVLQHVDDDTELD